MAYTPPPLVPGGYQPPPLVPGYTPPPLVPGYTPPPLLSGHFTLKDLVMQAIQSGKRLDKNKWRPYYPWLSIPNSNIRDPKVPLLSGAIPGGAPSAPSAPSPPSPAADPPSTAPSYDVLGYLNKLLGGLPEKAHGLALADVEAQVNAIKAQQEILMQQAHQRATQFQLASGAAANLLKPIAGQTNEAYRNAAQDQAAFASGFTGLAGTQAKAAAAKVAADLHAVGAPLTTMAPNGIDIATQPASLGNTVFSLGGEIPASTLEQHGLAERGFEKTLPAAARSAGAQSALATLGAGHQAANNLLPDILNAEGQLPKITNSYLSSLQSQAQNQALLPALLAGKYDALPGFNPVTGGKTSKQTAIEQADMRLVQGSQKIQDAETRNRLYGIYTSARVAALKSGPNSRQAKDFASTMKQFSDAGKDLERWTSAGFIGSGANAVPKQQITDYPTLLARLAPKYPLLARHPKILKLLIEGWSDKPAAVPDSGLRLSKPNAA